MLLSWTLDGVAPSDSVCSGVDELVMTWTTSRCAMRIAPVPCALDKWRDERPVQGSGTVELELLDTAGHSLGYGSAPATVTASLPSTPTAIAIDRF